MFGVVLWSDSAENKAVIWCEDHGDLAFYRNEGEDITLDAGDLVVFEVSSEAQFRFAHNPKRIEGDARPGLASALEQTVIPGLAPFECDERQSAQVIPFVNHGRHGNAKTREASLHQHN